LIADIICSLALLPEDCLDAIITQVVALPQNRIVDGAEIWHVINDLSRLKSRESIIHIMAQAGRLLFQSEYGNSIDQITARLVQIPEGLLNVVVNETLKLPLEDQLRFINLLLELPLDRMNGKEVCCAIYYLTCESKKRDGKPKFKDGGTMMEIVAQAQRFPLQNMDGDSITHVIGLVSKVVDAGYTDVLIDQVCRLPLNFSDSKEIGRAMFLLQSQNVQEAKRCVEILTDMPQLRQDPSSTNDILTLLLNPLRHGPVPFAIVATAVRLPLHRMRTIPPSNICGAIEKMPLGERKGIMDQITQLPLHEMDPNAILHVLRKFPKLNEVERGVTLNHVLEHPTKEERVAAADRLLQLLD
jgi:hypothetical protein